MSKHTPGPWKQHLVDETLIVDSRGNEVAQATGNYLTDYERVEKDARLIAAAPELLEALKAIIGACDAAGKDDDLSIIDTLTAEMEDAARAAIAKATGGHP